MGKSFYLPDWEGLSDIDTIADENVLDVAGDKALAMMMTLSGLVNAIIEQKKRVIAQRFRYKIHIWSFRDMYPKAQIEYIVCVLQIPSEPGLKTFRVDDTYKECYCESDAIYEAKKLVERFREKGIAVEFDETRSCQ
jgi:hypothetical protein